MSYKTFAYKEGYQAFSEKILPSSCPYLNEYGDNCRQINEWIEGWSDAFAEFSSKFS